MEHMLQEFEKQTLAWLHHELLDECLAFAIPKNAGRTNLESRPRSLLLGLFTRRGMGLSKGTLKHLRLLGLVHALARRRPQGGSEHPYCAVMVNRLDAGQKLDMHMDEYNSFLNWIMPLANNFEGGQLWVQSGEPSDYVHRAGESPLDEDPFTERGVAVLRSESPMLVEGVAGSVVGSPGTWVCLDSRRRRCVLPVLKGPRVSIALFSPSRLSAVPTTLWKRMASLGFRVGPILSWLRTLPSSPFSAPRGAAQRRSSPCQMLGAITAATAGPCVAEATATDRGAALRLGWQLALHGPRNYCFRPSRFCDFFRKEKSALKAGVAASGQPSAEGLQWPCGWPYPEAELSPTCPLPRSRRRRSRWWKWRELKRFVNFK
eukprot:2263270-Amphidinium_carterae.4